MPAYIDLYDILPDIKVGYSRYWESEKEVISPALKSAGYQLDGPWYTGEGDSFGPLSRCIRVTTPDDKRVIVVYG